MARTIVYRIIGLLLVVGIVFAHLESRQSAAQAAPAPTAVCSAPAWAASTVYTSGDIVAHGGRDWRAQWWTKGEEPGTTGEWGVWQDKGPCQNGSTPTVSPTIPSPSPTTPCSAPPWNRDAIYQAGAVVAHRTHHWQAKWWTKGEEPGTTGEWGVWQDKGPCESGGTPTATASPTIIPTATASPTIAPTASPTIAPTASPTPTPIRYETYLAAAGDTLAGIAARLGSTPQAIAAINHLPANLALRPGRPLVVPVFAGDAHGAGGLTIYQANPASPKVALTFDTERWESDPAAVYAILGVLRARNIHATFFLCGNWTSDFPAVTRAIIADGHEIGNHSMTHPDFTQLSPTQAAAEIDGVEQLVSAAADTTTRPYFRLPYGSSNQAVLDLLAQRGYIAYFWTAVDAGVGDWINQIRANPSRGNGAILLFHSASANAAALDGWLNQIISLGLRPTSLGDALN